MCWCVPRCWLPCNWPCAGWLARLACRFLPLRPHDPPLRQIYTNSQIVSRAHQRDSSNVVKVTLKTKPEIIIDKEIKGEHICVLININHNQPFTRDRFLFIFLKINFYSLILRIEEKIMLGFFFFFKV